MNESDGRQVAGVCLGRMGFNLDPTSNRTEVNEGSHSFNRLQHKKSLLNTHSTHEYLEVFCKEEPIET